MGLVSIRPATSIAGRIETRNLSYQNILSNEIGGLDTVSAIASTYSTTR